MVCYVMRILGIDHLIFRSNDFLQIALVITDGKQTTTSSYTRLSVASQGMKNKGVIIYAVGVGAGADRAQLTEIASGSKYVYTSTSFKDLQNIAPTIRKRLCQSKLFSLKSQILTSVFCSQVPFVNTSLKLLAFFLLLLLLVVR